jgi:DNA-binding NarL/FixJ family response regulator
MLAAELVALHLEEGRLTDAREMMSGVIGGVGCGLISEKPFVVGMLELRIAAATRDVLKGRAWFESLLAGPCPHDYWYVTSDIFELVWSALAVEIPADEVRRRVIDEFLAAHPARERLAAMVEGLLLMSEQQHDEAIVALRSALEWSTEHLQRPILGTMLVTLAQALQATGDRAGAQVAVEQALDALARWPGWRRDRAEALAVRLAGAAVRPVGELTARETEVAALIAEGLTNGQLAERLFISPKTAAVHVSNILAKLGLATRAEVAAWEIRRQLPAAGA